MHAGQHAARASRQTLVIVSIVLGLVLVAAGLVLVIPSTNAAPTLHSVGSGAWSDPATWSGGRVPSATDPATIESGTTVTVTGQTQVAGVTVAAGGRLTFDPNASATLASTRNILVGGTLSMRPASASVVQTIRFTGVDEARFVGGGMDPVDSDVGLWVMGAGQLDLAGTPKTGWTRAAGTVAAGATEVPLQTAPTGWQAGDDVSIAPTARPDGGSDFYKGFDETTVAGSSSGSVRLASRPGGPIPRSTGSGRPRS